ncbi:hypothetical protein THOM_1017 [Trachipleistophora hominis]|uniref:Uncharacterized protein n=1 Tax=Trachipleistophora hominis TaxID=72359 RepID=L7JX64_TRAHO|nr:hypothetical protein THOM_1017 [Trachipleistophora hominis]
MTYDHESENDLDKLLVESDVLKTGKLRDKTNVAGRQSDLKKGAAQDRQVILEGLDEYENDPELARAFKKIDVQLRREHAIEKGPQVNARNYASRNYEGTKDTFGVKTDLDETQKRQSFYGVGRHPKGTFDLKERLDVDRKADNVQNYMQIQMELDRLRETHRRMFAVKGKIYQAVEKEMAKFKNELKEKTDLEIRRKDEEINRINGELEALKKEYNAVKDERDKFRTVYFKLKEKYKNRK